jgi:hypothetical protein
MSNSFWEAADKTMYLLNDVFDVDLEWEQINGFYRPKYYLYTSFMAQAVNFVVYTLLLIFAESGLLGKIIHRFQLCLISVKSDYVFSKEIAAEEFMSSNNIVEPIMALKTERRARRCSKEFHPFCALRLFYAREHPAKRSC